MYVMEILLRLPMIAFNNCYEHEVIDQNEYALYMLTYFLSRLCVAQLPTQFSELASY